MKKSVLFVDDELNVIQGLKRMLRVLRNEWDMYFAGGGEEALDILLKHHIDVIVSDMRMPGMNGVELLNKVMELYPSIVRIILSGHSDQEIILQSAKTAHQFLTKPCEADVLKHTIERTIALRDLLSNEKLLGLVAGIKDLPSLPSLYVLLMEEIQSPEVSLKKVGNIIAQDLVMTAKVLQLVNSAFFGLSQKVTNPQQAVTLLGINTLSALVLYVQVFSTFKTDPRLQVFSMEDLWQHSMAVGSLAKEIARVELANKKMAEDAFIAGMMHDLGKLLLLVVPGYYSRVNEVVKNKGCSVLEAEYEVLDNSHAEVGAYLLGLWGIPHSIVEAVAYHHYPSKISGNKFTVLTAVHVANALLIHKDSSTGTTEFPHIDYEYLAVLNLTGKLTEWSELCHKVSMKGV